MPRNIIIAIASIILLTVALLTVCDRVVHHAAEDRLYSSAAKIPQRKVGLVLGTSPISTWNGRRNYYFDYRVRAAAHLYKEGKVEWLVVSGGDYRNTENGYDEPVAMRDSLIKYGVDSTKIILDYDGTRTLNSIAKMRDVYHQDSFTIISQKYHNERALYQAQHLGADAIAYNAATPSRRVSRWRNRAREVLARVKLFVDIARNEQPDIKETVVSDFTEPTPDVLSLTHISTPHGDLICLKPDMTRLTMDMVCDKIPPTDNDSIVLAFAGAFTGEQFGLGHINIAGDHVSSGKRFHGYPCTRNTGAFTWSPVSQSRFHYQVYSSELDRAASEGGMGFGQEMMIHHGEAVKTIRPSDNRHVFRALCLDANGDLAIYESEGTVAFGNFIKALLSQNVQEAIYTDMGPGWNYCFYRQQQGLPPSFLHDVPESRASNFIVFRTK